MMFVPNVKQIQNDVSVTCLTGLSVSSLVLNFIVVTGGTVIKLPYPTIHSQ